MLPDEVSPGPSERHVETSGIIEKADALVLIGSHTGQDDKVLLSALKGIHAGYFNFLHKEEKDRMKCQTGPFTGFLF